MKIKSALTTLVSMALAFPVAVAGCDTYLGYTFMNFPTSPASFGAGLQVQPGEDGGATYWIPNVDATFGLGSKLIVKPAIGLCTSTGGPAGFDSGSEVTLGGGAAVNVFSQAGTSVNLQAAVTHISYDGGSEQTFPVTAAARFAAGSAANLFGGAGLQFSRDSSPGSELDTDPVLFGGVDLGTSVDITVGLMLKFGEDGLGGSSTDVALNAAFGLPLG